MKEYIDLRSDTVTQPTEEMREAMYKAKVGDDILGEDPTVKELERMAADMLGKEDALFLASGTMANQIAVMAFANRGEEIIVGDTSHIYNLEVGGLSALSQVQPRLIKATEGYYDIDELEGLIREPGIQNAKTGLICIENTMNLNAGMAVSVENINQVCEIGKKHGIPVYMDGARLFNAAEALNCDVKDIVKNIDAVMFALTKGLAAPFGAILAGTKEFIEKARWMKQRIGGGFRQAGFLAAPAIVALNNMRSRLSVDHEHAKFLGDALSKIRGIKVDTSKIQTNIVTGDVSELGITIDEFLEKLLNKGIKAKRISKTSFRMVTHYGIEKEQLEYVIGVVEEISKNLSKE